MGHRCGFDDEGENVIAVEVHQSSSSSSDISFDLELKAYYFGGVSLVDSLSYGGQISDVSYGRDHQSEIGDIWQPTLDIPIVHINYKFRFYQEMFFRI